MSQNVLTLLLFLAPLVYSPGPGNLFFAALGARFGWRGTLLANLGYHAATLLMSICVGFGLLSILKTVPPLFVVTKVGGSLYVLWIAVRMWSESGARQTEAATRAGFREGAVLLILNPKAYVIMALMFSQFLDPARAPLWPAIVLISVIFTANNMLAFTLWTFAGDRIARLFSSPSKAQPLNKGLSALLVCVALWMLVA